MVRLPVLVPDPVALGTSARVGCPDPEEKWENSGSKSGCRAAKVAAGQQAIPGFWISMF